MRKPTHFQQWTDQNLIAGLRTAVKKEKRATAELLATMAEVDQRQLFLLHGPSRSMHAFCTHKLAMGEHEAFDKIRAARAARQFPQILEKIANGKLHVTAVRVLAPALTHQNCAKLLSEAEGKSTDALKEIVAALRPKADVALSIRRLPTPPAHPKTPKPTRPSQKNPQSTRFEPSPSRETPAPAIAPAQKTKRPHFEPTARERYAFRFAAGKAFRNKYEEARALLSHAIPGGDPESILERALDLLIADTKKKRFGLGARSKKAQETEENQKPVSRAIPVATRRAIAERDDLRCTFVGVDGTPCGSQAFLEIHHWKDFALGGDHTLANTGLLCRAHNQYLAHRTWGQKKIQQQRDKCRKKSAHM